MTISCFTHFHSCELITSSNSPDETVEINTPVIGKLEFSSDSDCEQNSSSDDYFSSNSSRSSSSDVDELSEFDHVFSNKLIRKERTSQEITNEDTKDNNAFSKDSNEECSKKDRNEEEFAKDGNKEEVSIKCFCSTIHVRNVFCIQCDGYGKWWNSTRSCIKIKKGASMSKFQ